jgi:hypothetical protein
VRTLGFARGDNNRYPHQPQQPPTFLAVLFGNFDRPPRESIEILRHTRFFRFFAFFFASARFSKRFESCGGDELLGIGSGVREEYVRRRLLIPAVYRRIHKRV